MGDLDLDGRWLRVERTTVERRKSATGNGTRFQTKPYSKGGHPRRLRISLDLQQLLTAWIEQQRLTSSDRLFSMPEATEDGAFVQRTDE